MNTVLELLVCAQHYFRSYRLVNGAGITSTLKELTSPYSHIHMGKLTWLAGGPLPPQLHHFSHLEAHQGVLCDHWGSKDLSQRVTSALKR